MISAENFRFSLRLRRGISEDVEFFSGEEVSAENAIITDTGSPLVDDSGETIIYG